MIFEYFGNTQTQEELSVRLSAGPDVWVSNEELEVVAQEAGFETRGMAGATFEDLRRFLDAEIPVIINYIDPDNSEGHFAVVIGYTDDSILLNVPWYGKDFLLPITYLADHWRSFEGNRSQWLLAISNKSITV